MADLLRETSSALSMANVQFQRRLSEDARAIWAGRLGTQPQPVGRACPAKSATPVAQQTQQQTKKGLFQWVKIKLCCGGPKTLP